MKYKIKPKKFSDINCKDISKFKLGKTYKYSINKSYIHFYYNDENIIFQTPILFVPYQVRIKEIDSFKKYENYYLEANFLNKQLDNRIIEFENWLINIEKIILNLLKKRPYLNIKNGNKNSILKYDDYRNCNKLILKLDVFNSHISILEKKNKLSKCIDFKKDLNVPCHGLFSIEIQSIWINYENKDAPTWGLKCLVRGGQMIPSHIIPIPIENKTEIILDDEVLEEYLNDLEKTKLNLKASNLNKSSIGQGLIGQPFTGQFSTPHPPPPPLPEYLNNSNNNTSQIPEFVKQELQKLQKMRKYGIPINQIYQKMGELNLDKRLLDNPNLWFEINNSNISNSNSNKNNFNDNFNNNNILNRSVKIDSQMLNSVILKKNSKKKDVNIKKKIIPNNAKIFSLSEIINSKNNLKKVDFKNFKSFSSLYNNDYLNNMNDTEL